MSRSKLADLIPAQPFADWLNERIEHWQTVLPGDPKNSGALYRVLEEIGWTPGEAGVRRLYRYRKCLSETRTGRNIRKGIPGVCITVPVAMYPRPVVEDALHHAGVLFSDLYPAIAASEELWLEPAKWCPGCQASHTPINGQCPFCDWRLGPPTGQQLRGERLAA
jgi:hypothetical protein